jgi:hypothetical protein
MTWTIEGSNVRYDDGPKSSFEYPVEELTEIGDMAVVVLTVPRNAVMTENVFGVSRDGTRLWQIEWYAATGTYEKNCYVGVTRAEPEKGIVHIANFNGDVVDVNLKTGKVMGHQFLK